MAARWRLATTRAVLPLPPFTRLAARACVERALRRDAGQGATMAGMRLAGKVLAHQVHPAKIGADVMASMVSNVLLWKAQPKAAVAVRVLLPVAGSAAVLSMADLEALARTRRGGHVLSHMPPSAQAVRLAGDALMGFGAHRRSLALLLAGAAVIMAGWSHSAWPQTSGRT